MHGAIAEDIQALHRLRERTVKERTALANQIRGLLAEYGIVIRLGISAVRKALPEILEDGENGLTPRGRACFARGAGKASAAGIIPHPAQSQRGWNHQQAG